MANVMDTLSAKYGLVGFDSVKHVVGILLAATILYVLYTVIYNIFFHPLKHIPGPLSAKISGIPYVLHIRNGTICEWIQQLHTQYGEAIRLAPNEVSFISGETAWPDIYGFRTGKYKNTGSYDKDRTWFPEPVNGVWSIITADEDTHSRMRRNLSHAFSDKALRQQEPLIQSYVDLLVHQIGEHAAKGENVDMMSWYNYTTFDIISDLSFGEPLYCLRDAGYHKWVHLIYAFVKATGFVATRSKYPLFNLLDTLHSLFADTTALARIRTDFANMAREKVERRLEKIKGYADSKPDFWSHVIANQEVEGKRLERGEMHSNAITLLVAGSETTATTLTGTTYFLLTHPSAYAKLVHEIRSAFTSPTDITMDKVNKLSYLHACIQETLRAYPPVPTGFPRVVPRGGATISDLYIPGGTSVYVSQHATNHSERNFREPDMWVPERWLGDEKFEADRREVVNPFSFGPRACLGKNLAYAEMRLVLAKVLFAFDLELVRGETDWMEQKCFTLWEKEGLQVKLKPVER